VTSGAAATSVETIGTALARCRAALAAAGTDSPALEARLLVAAALGTTNEQIIAWPERAVVADGLARLDELLRRRLMREPMAHILGRREFWSLDFTVTPDVLTPRPDSETLVAAVLDQLGDRGQALSILDLGTGTGCLLLALLSELPQATGVGIDASEAALAVARRNAGALQLTARAAFRQGNWTQDLDRRFDVVASNPPYIATSDLAGLSAEVRCEPALALDGGYDGLAAYRALVPDLRRVLAPDGLVALEIGAGQASDVEGILVRGGLEPIARHTDLTRIVRCLLARPVG
jgi:release factor glutamine methyltransferase